MINSLAQEIVTNLNKDDDDNVNTSDLFQISWIEFK